MEGEDTPPAVHPLVIWLAGQLKPAASKEEKVTVDPSALDEVKRVLLTFAGDELLRTVAHQLFSFAFVVQRDLGSATLAKAITTVLNDRELVAAMEALAPPKAPAEEVVAATATRFTHFTDREKKKAPKVGAKAPKGSVKLDRLTGTRRV